MSDVGMLLNQAYNFNEKEDKAVEQFADQKSTTGEKKLKVIKIIFVILCIILIGELIAYRYVMPSFASPKVTIRGNQVYSAEEIASKFVPMNCTSWFDFDVEEGVAILLIPSSLATDNPKILPCPTKGKYFKLLLFSNLVICFNQSEGSLKLCFTDVLIPALLITNSLPLLLKPPLSVIK